MQAAILDERANAGMVGAASAIDAEIERELDRLAPSTSFVHPMAVVQSGCKIGARSRIYQFASVLRGAEIGEDCIVSPGAQWDGSKMGDRSILAPNVVAGHGFLVGNDCFIGPNVTLCNDLWPRTRKDGFDLEHIESLRQYGEWCVIVEDGASIGANAVIMPGVYIGKNAMVSAGAVVTKSVPANRLLLRNGDAVLIDDEADRLRRRVRFASDPQHPMRR